MIVYTLCIASITEEFKLKRSEIPKDILIVARLTMLDEKSLLLDSDMLFKIKNGDSVDIETDHYIAGAFVEHFKEVLKKYRTPLQVP